MLPKLSVYSTPNDIKYLLFDQPEVISDEIRKNGVWNSASLEMCNLVLKKSSPGRVLDIGAGFGAFSIPLALQHPSFIYTAFEPLPVIHMQLNANVLLNSLENVRTYQYALSDKEELLDAPILDVQSSSNHGSYSFDQHVNNMRGMVPFHKSDVYQFRTVDSFRFANVKLVKVSTPGMELKVLQGMHQTLVNNGFPPVLFESWNLDWYKEEKAKVIDFFASRAYEHYAMLGEHIMAFKTKSEYEYALSEDAKLELGSFKVVEQAHETSSVLANQTALK